ncbi:MAG: hypothetical protein JWO44_1791 [Bacteroidetes bacterium]|nr:hypothetical protein [Bacteroidota bacterium]
MINERVKYTASTKWATISTANSNLDGTGSISSVITGASNGTFVKSVIIKALGNTTRGIVRIYIMPFAGGAKGIAYLLTEVNIPAVTQSSKTHSFSTIVNIGYTLKSGDILYASTEKADTFYVIAEGLNWAY